MNYKKKIITIIGARPQFIKAALVSRELKKEKHIEEIIIHTGQHFDTNMSDIFFEELELEKPKYNLKINGGYHGEMTGKMMQELEPILLKETPNAILLYGDTNSTLAGAITGRKLNIPVFHVEAGLRNNDMTVPEDVNRILTDRISTLLFCPTPIAIDNLINEGFKKFDCQLITTGDLMYDAALHFSRSNYKSEKIISIRPKYAYSLVTIHRSHNTDASGIFEVFGALNEIALNKKLLFPIHPRTKKAIEEYNIKLHPNIILIEPQGYRSMIDLINGADELITDSGGIQKEAYALNKKALLLMNYTPWVELVENGFSIVTEIKKEEILKQYCKLNKLNPDFSMKLYGNGNSSYIIVKSICEYLKNQ